MDIAEVTSPNAEPLDLAMAKLQIGATGTDRDPLIALSIGYAREDVEELTNRQLIHARYKLVLDRFPNAFYQFGYSLNNFEAVFNWRQPRDIYRHLPPNAIVITPAPVVRVVSVTYTDQAGAPQTVSANDYVANLTATPSFIAPVWGKVWPVALYQQGSVVVTYDAGYASKFTADATANTLTVSSSPKTWAINDVVRLTNSGGLLPAPLAVNTDYYIVAAAAGVYQVSATSGGTAIDLTTTGTGTNYIGEVPLLALQNMLLRIEASFQVRGGVLVLDRGMKLESHPMLNSMLDPLVVYWT